MRIAYVAKHGSGGNDDEGAITFALEQLGHTVERLPESLGNRAHRLKADFLLFHGWHDIHAISQIKLPKVFWFFDLVSFPDPLLARRNQTRMRWISEVTELVDIGFLTDGDWVEKDRTGKLVHLMQGADGRKLGVGNPGKEVIPILFTGISRGGGQLRESFVAEMQARYGSMFRHVSKGVYGRDLADLIASSQIVVAPDGPVTHKYWSNRVYNTLGFHGFMLHPYCRLLAEFLRPDIDIVYYFTREQLHKLISSYLSAPNLRKIISENGFNRVKAFHTYLHQCEFLVKIVRERLL